MEVIVGYSDHEFWLDNLRRALSFAGGRLVSALAANFSEVQLINPAASGVVVLVYKANVGAPAGVTVQLRSHGANLTTDAGAGTNLDIGGAAAASHVRTDQVGAASGALISELHRPTNTDVDRFPLWLAQLDAGEGIVITTDAVNQAVSAEFFWVETPV